MLWNQTMQANSNTMTTTLPDDRPWAEEHQTVLKKARVDPEQGLSSADAAERRDRYGPNLLRESKHRNLWLILWDQCKGQITLLLAVAAVLAFMRLIQASKLQADESMLTGESLPVSKRIDPLDSKTELATRSNMLFKGTALTRGSGEGVVIATGMQSQLGAIHSLVEEAEEEITPLEKRLDRLARKLIGVTLAVAGMTTTLGILAGKDIFLMVETGIALARGRHSRRIADRRHHGWPWPAVCCAWPGATPWSDASLRSKRWARPM